jgi:BRCA1-associated protein
MLLLVVEVVYGKGRSLLQQAQCMHPHQSSEADESSTGVQNESAPRWANTRLTKGPSEAAPEAPVSDLSPESSTALPAAGAASERGEVCEAWRKQPATGSESVDPPARANDFRKPKGYARREPEDCPKWLDFRAGNPEIPLDTVTGRIHLLADRQSARRVQEPQLESSAPAASTTAAVRKPTESSLGDHIARSILEHKQSTLNEDEDQTKRAEVEVGTPKTLAEASSDSVKGSHATGEVPAAHWKSSPSSLTCSDFARRHAKASMIFDQTTLLCMLGVPGYLSTADLAQFVAPFRSRIRRMRIVWDLSYSNSYAVLLRFLSPDDAVLFLMEYDGRAFSEALASERCRVLPVERVVYRCTSKQSSRLVASLALPSEQDGDEIVEYDESTSSDANIGHLEEWPTCPVCLDRLDLESILMGLCNHALHTACLARWGDPSCPVCRFVSETLNPQKTSCQVCNAQTQLWICLVCGHVGCGRYVQHHALAHFRDTNHVFAMELQSGRVWDYGSDSYVHRVLLNEVDGKHAVLEMRASTGSRAVAASGVPYHSDGGANAPASSSQRSAPEIDEERTQLFAATIASKVDSLSQEYEMLLLSQLESQRLWYEAKATELERAWSKRVQELEQRLERISKPKCSRDAATGDGAGNEFDAKLLRELNERLLRDAAAWREQVERLKRERDELAEQVNDLLQHIEASAKLSARGNNSTSIRLEALRNRRITKP